MQQFLSRIQHWLTELNVFKSGKNDLHIIHEERWSTRLYFVLLLASLVILILYTGFAMHSVNVTVNNPSQTTFENLQVKYPDTLKCPCSQIAVKYQDFIQIEPIFHQVCSSSIVTQEWITDSYGANSSSIWPVDVRTFASAQAQFLQSFCSKSQLSIAYVLKDILSTALISATALPSSLVQLQVNTLKSAVQSTSSWELIAIVTSMRLVISSSQFISGLGTNAFAYIPTPTATSASVKINVYDANGNSSTCFCVSMSNCPMPGMIYSIPEVPNYGYYDVAALSNGSIPVKGFQVSCYPLESVLTSTLECYFDSTCLQLLVPKSTSFLPLIFTNTSRFPLTTTVEALMNEVMVEQWLFNISLAAYYAECAPYSCSYSFIERNNFLIIITTIIAVIGGLNTVLRIIVPWIIGLIMRLKRRCRFADATPETRIVWVQGPRTPGKVVIFEHAKKRMAKEEPEMSTEEAFEICKFLKKVVCIDLDFVKDKLLWLWTQLKSLNLFDSKSNDLSKQKRERQTTRLYIVLLSLTFTILLFYTALTEETQIYTVRQPSQTDYQELRMKYPDTIQCPCTNITMPYSTFITIDPVYHQICSSQFISPQFLIQLALIKEDPLYKLDFMLSSSSYFQWLTTFCELSALVISNQYAAIQSQLFINDKLLSPAIFDIQANQLVQSFTNDTAAVFFRVIKQLRELVGSTQLLSTTSVSYTLPINPATGEVLVQPSGFSGCSCLLNPTSCSINASFYTYNATSNTYDLLAMIMGVRLACGSMESIFQSNLACWYSSNCYAMVINVWQNWTFGLALVPPLLDGSLRSQFQPSTLLSDIINQLMVEQWSTEIFYSSFFAECAPQYCTYSVTTHKSIISIVTTLFGLFGGLNVAFKILTPLIIQAAYWLIARKYRQLCSYAHIREIPSRLNKLNLFYNVHTSSEITLHKERHSSRLYLVLLIGGLTAFVFYHSLIEQIKTITIEQPTQEAYEKLLYSEAALSLQCPCTQITTPYEKFVQVNTSFHEVCSSAFVEQAWLESIFGDGDWSNLSTTEFRSRGVLYFQWVRSLCSVVQENITHYSENFLSSLLVSARLLSETELSVQVSPKIDQVIASSRADATTSYHCGRDLINNNQLMSVYSSNWIYKAQNTGVGQPIPTEPVSHGNCSCATSVSCTEPATLNGEIIPGLLIGCGPLESIFRSSLVCLYNQTCLDKINLGSLPVKPLNASLSSQYPLNRTIEDLVNNVFDEEWSVKISYSNFFKQCQPSSCFYTVNQRDDILQIIITLLGIYGGLTVALHIIVPYIVDFIHLATPIVVRLRNTVRPRIVPSSNNLI